jgi:ferrous iron transport protein B
MRKIRMALSGKPNAGKSTVCNAITGARQHIANYPGVTVEKKYGSVNHKGHEIEVVDLPGTYSLTAYSLEEIVARNFLVNERPDVVVDIVDASNLDRNLYLAVQFRELGIPLIIALNMVDVATTRGIKVDEEVLSNLFGVPVVPTVARSNKGIKNLLDKIVEVAQDERYEWWPEIITYGSDIDESLNKIEDIIKKAPTLDKKYPERWLALKCLEGDDQIMELMKKNLKSTSEIEGICKRVSRHMMNTLEEEPEGIIADHRYGYIAGITKKSVKREIESRLNLSDKVDKVLTNRVIGPVIMLLILYGIYEFTFRVSEAPVSWFEAFFGWLKGTVTGLIPEGHLHSLVVSGVIDGVGGVLGFVPLIMFMFFAIAIMEDFGYMARAAYMLDRVLRWFGLHGSSVMALLVSGGISGGCAVPGVMATRTLRDPKERIATLLVVPFMNCGAKLPVFGMLIAAFFAKDRARMLFVFTILSWSFALFAAKIIRLTVLRGPKTPFVMELPPYRIPTIKGLLIHTWERTWQYIKKAGTVILGISILLWAMMTFPGLSDEQRQFYEDQHIENRMSFLTSPDVKAVVQNEKDLADLEEVLGRYEGFLDDGKENPESIAESPFWLVAEQIVSLKKSKDQAKKETALYLPLALAYINYGEKNVAIELEEQQVALKGTIAGRIGRLMEGITSTIGFDYRTNIALIGGFLAKEVIVSTLGTAYSLGEVDPEASVPLSEKLKNEPGWNPLVAFTLILFIMLYVPCFITVISIKRESSWKWAYFSMAFNLVIAYLVSLAVYQVGLALGM